MDIIVEIQPFLCYSVIKKTDKGCGSGGLSLLALFFMQNNLNEGDSKEDYHYV